MELKIKWLFKYWSFSIIKPILLLFPAISTSLFLHTHIFFLNILHRTALVAAASLRRAQLNIVIKYVSKGSGFVVANKGAIRA